MATAEVLAENEVTPSNWAQILKRAFFKASLDKDGDLIVHAKWPRIIVIVAPL